MRSPLHIIHRISKRLSYPRQIDLRMISDWFLPRFGSLVCDIGCGDGYWNGRLASKFGTHSVGIDVNVQAIKKANKWKVIPISYKGGCAFIVADAHALPFHSHIFDYVVSLSVLQFAKDDRLVLREIKRVLKKEGAAVLTCDSLSSKIISEAYRKKHQKKYQTYRYYNLEQLATTLEEAGLEIIASRYAVCSAISTFLLMLQEWFGKVVYLLTPIILPLLLVADKRKDSQTKGYKLAVFARPRS